MSAPPAGQQYLEPDEGSHCNFCDIVADGTSARVLYEDDEVMVIRNRLRWVPVMLLVIPKQHLTQREMWESSLMTKIADVALDMGNTHCPGGFRLLSNFGREAMQSQDHAHLHVLGGTQLGRYV